MRSPNTSPRRWASYPASAFALGEDDLDLWARPLPLGGRRERRGRDLVGPEPGLGRAAKHLGDDPGERLGATPLRRTVGDVRAGAVSTGDVAGIGQTSVDRPDRVGVHSEGGAELPDWGEATAGQEPARVDLVGELPVDLRRDRDVRVSLDVELSARRGGPLVVGNLVVTGMRRLSY